jgi:glycosyltransferase involved in cell wall biosynthesis
MVVTHLIYSLNTGGAEILLVDIANEQVSNANVSIVIINANYNKALLSKIDKRIKVRIINRKDGSRNLFKIIRLNFILFKLKSDVIHCHNHDIIPLVLHPFKLRSVLTIHSVNIEKKYFKYYRKLFAISLIVKEDILRRSGIPSYLVYNGICTEKFLQKADIPPGDFFKMVIVSRLDHNIKGQHLVLEALKLLREKGISKINLDLIGSGNSEIILRELIIEYGLIKQVKFLGLKDRDFIYTHLKDYDLLIQPSLYEGFGLTVVEAMAAKVPVLVSDIDGPMEIIGQGEFGFYFQSGNATNLGEKLEYITSNYRTGEISRKVEEAYKHTRKNFEISTTAQLYLNSY